MVSKNQRSQAILTVLFTTLLSHPAICRFLECGETYVDTNGTITKPRQPLTNNTNRLSSCRLTIDTRNQSITGLHHLQLHVKAFDVTGNMPSCNHGNYLEILIGCRFISVGRFCGVSTFPVFYSTDGCLGLVLHGDIQQLQFEYSLRPLDREVQHIPSGCGTSRLANTRQGNIFSPRWPLPYPDYVDCVWTVRARKNLQIKLIFFDLDVNIYKPCRQRLDVLEVRAGSSGYSNARILQTKDKECGKKEPFHMIIKSDTFYITFRSERSTGPRGFMAGFVAYEKETPEFHPHILIVFGAALLVIMIVCLKKFAIPALSLVWKRIARKRRCQQCWFPKRLRECGYSCGCTKRPRRRSSKHEQIKDCSQLETPETPVIAKAECFLDPNDGWDPPASVESTFVPLPTSIPTIVKSASDIRCLSPYAYIGNFNERRSSCKSVRFVDSRHYVSAQLGSVFDS